MKKIVTDPRFVKTKKVLESCENTEQLITAIKFARLASTRIISDCTGFYVGGSPEYVDLDSIIKVKEFIQDMITENKERIIEKERKNEQNEHVRVQENVEQSECELSDPEHFDEVRFGTDYI